jgi:uncharacterized membrane protein YhhN
MKTTIFSLLALFSASLHIRAEYYGPHRHIYLFKPLTTLFIILIAILDGANWPFYKIMIVTGLAFSLMGDVFLMLPADRFIAGLIAFLVAHLCYSVAFGAEINRLVFWPLIPVVAVGVIVYMILAPSLGKLKIPVLIYISVILTMAWLAVERWNQFKTGGSFIAALGAVLFVISDTVLAVNRFRGPFKVGRALNLILYYTAQWLIARSIGT